MGFRIRHVGIVVSDMERSLRFYRDLLGFRIQRSMEESGTCIDRVLNLSGVRVNTVKLEAREGSTLLELLQFKSHFGDHNPSREIYDRGPSHVAFTVTDLDGFFQRLTGEGVLFLSLPQISPDGLAKVAFCKDPDGTFLELVEELKESCQ